MTDGTRTSGPAEAGARIVELRESLGLTTAELAAAADGLSPLPVSRLVQIERGEETATVRELLTLSRTLRCSPAEFLGHPGEPGPLPGAKPDEVQLFDPDAAI